jgi:hypothetical protein
MQTKHYRGPEVYVRGAQQKSISLVVGERENLLCNHLFTTLLKA